MRKGLLLFLLMVLAQWLLPLWTIFDQEKVLNEGVPLKFRTAPIDPHDPFRGEYVVLRFAIEDSLYQQPTDTFQHGERIAVILSEHDGEASAEEFQREEPGDDRPWLWARVSAYGGGGTFQVDLPFDRYYLEQGTGRRTEDLVYSWNGEEDARPAHALVHVANGNGVIADLLVDGRPIREIILEERAMQEAGQDTVQP
jgi:uncharacterized membrane-anchored protein